MLHRFDARRRGDHAQEARKKTSFARTSFFAGQPAGPGCPSGVGRIIISFASHVFAAQLASIHVTDSGTSSLSLDIDMDRGAGAMACAVCTVQWRWRVRGRWGVTGCVSACYGTGNTHCGFILKTQSLKRPNVNALIFCVILHN